MRRATSSQQRSRLRSLRDLDEAALTLADLDATVLAPPEPAGRLKTEDDPEHGPAYAQEHGESSETAYPHWSAEELHTYLADHRRLHAGSHHPHLGPGTASGRDDPAGVAKRVSCAASLPAASAADSSFTATSGVLPLTKAREFLMWLYAHPSKRNDDTVLNEAPVDFVPASWRKYVSPPRPPSGLDHVHAVFCYAVTMPP